MNRATPLLALTTLLAGLTAGTQALAATAPTYHQARWDPIHFQPAIATATDEQCLACHKEVLEPSISPQSPAGVKAMVAGGAPPASMTEGMEEMGLALPPVFGLTEV